MENCLKIDEPINMIMIYDWDKKLKKRLHVLEAGIITIFKKDEFDVFFFFFFCWTL